MEMNNEINVIIWKTEEEMQKELKERISNWKQGYSKDGYVEKGEGKFIYRGIAYLIKIIRYYNHTDKFCPMSRRISDCHVVVEYPEETSKIKDIIPYDFDSEWLYHDTLHSWNDNQTIEEQIEVCHKWAKKDIDNLLDGEIVKQIDEKIQELEKLKTKISKVRELIDGSN